MKPQVPADIEFRAIAAMGECGTDRSRAFGTICDGDEANAVSANQKR
jgi:hypothetical protein